MYDTTLSLTNGKLTITVVENPIINSILFEGEKAKKFTSGLKDLFILKEKGSYVSNNVKSDINIMKEFYRNLGFYFVKIDLEVEKLNRNRVNLE